ncbi:uncharacterized protein LOC142173443 [Nicotiana tabacum]|uniref:Uncharacterized protein LOC142173443 n=1 Tax=Nicotiana tabacum TaxID=4097 RepID=A0AC58TD29_TOBAC
MMEFDVIRGMDWLASCYANVDCWAKVVHFNFLRESVIEWKVDVAAPRGKFISYFKARKMIVKGCIYHLVQVWDADAKPPTLRSVPDVSEFPEVFPYELPSIPYEREIEFDIDVPPDTQVISISSYRTTHVELKELKAKLKDLLEKSFI